MVSSTAMPRQMANEQALAMSSDVSMHARIAPVATSGKMFGMTVSSPKRIERTAIVMTTKIITAARARL
jgi:hypothetical protein